MMREQVGDADLMTLVQGLHMLLRRGPRESSRIFIVDWRWY
jgi:hypothetical protein